MKARNRFGPLNRAAGLGGLLAIGAAGCPLTACAADWISENVRSTPWLSPAEEQKTFHLPPGFEMQLVAAEPDLFKPMNLAFDAKGRLWVTVTREYPYPVALDKTARDAIKILEDTDSDGRADKITTFADGLNIPIGLYPYRSGCIVWSIPNIWYLQDTDGDGQADKREVLYGPFDYSRDTHGNQASFRRGFDGWLYATHGYNNDSHVKGADGHEVHLNSGNTYRMRLDGSRIEQHTWGQVNPFGLAFDPLGNLYSSDCHSAPIYQLLAGGYYPSFGKPDDGLGFAPTMMEKPRGSTALCGISYYADDLWPEEFRNNTFMGDVLASSVLRDRLVEEGASQIARPRPDLVSTDDPWFRPVDTLLGPDGALYIADFYNRIIGHYEVPLNHPGRDRTSGRIWRVVYKGGGQARLRPAALPGDLPGLLRELASPSLPRRMLAMNTIVDNFGQEAATAVQEAARAPVNPQQSVHLLWVLHRLGSLPVDLWRNAARSLDPLVRVHAQRLAAEVLTPANALLPRGSLQTAGELGTKGLKDPHALVQRCAAETVGHFPASAHLRPLIDLGATVPPADTHLLYVVRKALRDQLQSESVFDWVHGQLWSESDTLALADVAIGVKSASAATFLLHQIALLSQQANAKPAIADVLKHAARYAPETELGRLADYASRQLPDGFSEALLFELGRQFALFKSVDAGLQQRGAALPAPVRQWGTNLVWRFFSSLDGYHTWAAVPVDDAATPNPWDAEKRLCADGQTRELTSSLPHGEQLTGILRSQPFDLPDQLSFWLCGHNGFPGQPDHKKNVIRLREQTTRVVLAEAFPPRNDTAQRITWDLSAHRGQRGFVEVADADTGTAFAWLAFGGFAPPLSPLRPSQFQPRTMTDWTVTACDLAARLQVKELAEVFARAIPLPNANVRREGDAEILAAFARSWAALDAANARPKLIAQLASADLTPAFRERLGLILAEQNSGDAKTAVAQSMKDVPYRVQQRWAVALTTSRDGADALLKAVEQGIASPRLLQSSGTKNRFKTANPPDWEDRLRRLTQNLPTADERLEKLTQQRRKTYDPAKARAADGAAVFTKNCAVCHSVAGQGGNVGPQLDGIGARGLERLCEDVLDPNRNVDRAFRTTLLTLKDGDIASGLFRRQEGQVVVLADSTGKEMSIPQQQIAERRESESSLMPENFGELLSEEDFHHLIAFLLSKGPR